MKLNALCVVIWLLLEAESIVGLSSTTEENSDYFGKLKQTLFGNNRIDPKRRPVLNHTTTVQVYVYLILLQVFDLNEETETLVTNGWADVYWRDEQILWNPEEYGGLTTIEIPEYLIWKPDLTIFNNAEPSTKFKYGQSLIHVYHDGYVYWFPAFTSKTSCPLDHHNFPFDQHICDIDIGSWTYGEDHVNVSHSDDPHNEDDTLKRFKVPNAHWEVTEAPVRTQKIVFECCPEDMYPYVRHTLILRRRSPLYKFTFVVPTIMSIIITLALFWLPLSGGKRFTLGGISIMVQMIILMGLTYSIPPGGTTIPQIVIFCGNSFVMSCLTTVISIFLNKLRKRHSYMALPSVIKNTLSGTVGKIICLNLSSTQEELGLGEKRSEGGMEAGPDISNSHNQGSTGEGVKFSQSSDWFLLAYALNNICFLLYCIIFTAIILSFFT